MAGVLLVAAVLAALGTGGARAADTIPGLVQQAFTSDVVNTVRLGAKAYADPSAAALLGVDAVTDVHRVNEWSPAMQSGVAGSLVRPTDTWIGALRSHGQVVGTALVTLVAGRASVAHYDTDSEVGTALTTIGAREFVSDPTIGASYAVGSGRIDALDKNARRLIGSTTTPEGLRKLVSKNAALSRAEASGMTAPVGGGAVAMQPDPTGPGRSLMMMSIGALLVGVGSVLFAYRRKTNGRHLGTH